MPTKKQIAATEKQEAITKLLSWLTPGQTIYTVLRHVSTSGMQREISLFAIVRVDQFDPGELTSLDYWVKTALGYRIGKHGGIVMTGCGMDMGFSLVYNLGSCLWRTGTPQPHGMRNGVPDSTGGYALKHRWL